jgi:hypothetical protein
MKLFRSHQHAKDAGKDIVIFGKDFDGNEQGKYHDA